MITGKIGPYEVLAELGRGGMGEVYRARDAKLNRDVALKILSTAFVTDADRLARFRREAQVLASLNHPNIAAIYGFEDSGATHALVLELVEGETLADRIAHGPLALADALPLARQIAEALEAAHELGIVHRDLKPANIKVRADGTVKVLDFGLAKAVEPAGSSGAANAANSPTLTGAAFAQGYGAPGTQLGIILGTAAYMAPEQARGKAVDKRADVWAFGATLFEMLTGKRAFAGDEVSDVLAAVLRQDIDWSALPPDTPPRIRGLLERCLDRDPKTRLRDIGEARVALGNSDRSDGPAAAPREGRRMTVVSTAAIAIAAAIIAALVVLYMRPPVVAPSSPVVRLPFEAPDSVVSEVGDATISPDGKTMLFSGRSADGKRQLWVRPLDSVEATPLPDTEDAIEPFWSWDSKSVAFGAQGKLKRFDLGTARAQVLTDAARSNNGSWSRSGVIVFSPDYRAAIFKVAATGGPREPVTPLAADDGGHRYPMFLPDGRHFLYWAGSRVMVGSLDSKETKELLPVGPAVYAPPGWLLYVRSGIIVAHAFDAARLELSGEPVPIAPGDPGAAWARGARLSVSDTGVLAIARAPMYDAQLAWFDRAGAPAGTLGPVRSEGVGQYPRLAPDGLHVAIQINDAKTQNQDIWIGDVIRGKFERLTTTPTLEQMPVWSQDGQHLFASTGRNQIAGIYRIPVGSGTDDLVLTGTVFPVDVTGDGRWLFFTQRGERTRLDIWALPLTNGLPSKGATPQLIVGDEFDESNPQVSQDGKWLAYISDVTGSSEVYVRRLTDGHVGPAAGVTDGHGVMPRWSRDGRTLYFVSAPQGFLSAQMMSMTVTSIGDALQFGPATPVFKARMLPILSPVRGYDVTSDGKFLVEVVVGPSKNLAATVVLNWPAVMRK